MPIWTWVLALAGGAWAAPEGGAKITLPCSWEEGTTFHYEYQRKRFDAANPVVAKVQTTTPAAVTVTKAGNPTHFSYDTGVPVFSGPNEAIQAVKQAMGDADMPAMDLVMHDGNVTEVANRVALIDAMEPMIRKMAEGAPPQVIEQTLAMFREPEMGNQLLLQEPGKLFALHCVEIQEGQVVDLPIDFPNPFGGPPIKGRSRVEAGTIDPKTNTVVISTSDTMDEGAVKALLPQVFEKIMPGMPIPEGSLEMLMSQMPPIESSTKGRAVYSMADGFPVEVSFEQQVGASGHPMAKSDRWSWKRVDAPKK